MITAKPPAGWIPFEVGGAEVMWLVHSDGDLCVCVYSNDNEIGVYILHHALVWPLQSSTWNTQARDLWRDLGGWWKGYLTRQPSTKNSGRVAMPSLL